jgi:hypothetical protein
VDWLRESLLAPFFNNRIRSRTAPPGLVSRAEESRNTIGLIERNKNLSLEQAMGHELWASQFVNASLMQGILTVIEKEPIRREGFKARAKVMITATEQKIFACRILDQKAPADPAVDEMTPKQRDFFTTKTHEQPPRQETPEEKARKNKKTVTITELSRTDLLYALWEQAAKLSKDPSPPWSDKEAEKAIAAGFIDTFFGRIIKVDLRGDEVDFIAFDNSEPLARGAEVVDKLNSYVPNFLWANIPLNVADSKGDFQYVPWKNRTVNFLRTCVVGFPVVTPCISSMAQMPLLARLQLQEIYIHSKFPEPARLARPPGAAVVKSIAPPPGSSACVEDIIEASTYD